MSCDPTISGFTPASDYVLGLAGEQLTEMGMDANGSLAWAHTNVFAAGKLIATYDPDGLHFYMTDPLGTRRAQTDYAGVLEQTCSSLPYGDSLACTGSIQFPTEHHFTGKERDAETNNDYFGARYYSSAMGRWMSPDWASGADAVPYADFGNPQSLNLYGYVRNNPLAGVDPDGHILMGQEFNLGPGSEFSTEPMAQTQSTTQNPPAQQTDGSGSYVNHDAVKSAAERISMGLTGAANTVVGLPKAVGGAASLIVGTLGSETGVGLGVAAFGSYELTQGSGQLSSGFLQVGAAVTGKTAGIDEKVDQITVHTSAVGYLATKLNGGDVHTGAKWASAEGLFSGSLRRELFKGITNLIDTIMSIKDLATK